MVDFLKEADGGTMQGPPVADPAGGLVMLPTLTPLITSEQAIGVLNMGPYSNLCLAISFTKGSLTTFDIYVKWGNDVDTFAYLDPLWVYDESDNSGELDFKQKKFQLVANITTVMQFRNPGMPFVKVFYNGNAGIYTNSSLNVKAFRGWVPDGPMVRNVP